MGDILDAVERRFGIITSQWQDKKDNSFLKKYYRENKGTNEEIDWGYRERFKKQDAENLKNLRNNMRKSISDNLKDAKSYNSQRSRYRQSLKKQINDVEPAARKRVEKLEQDLRYLQSEPQTKRIGERILAKQTAIEKARRKEYEALEKSLQLQRQIFDIESKQSKLYYKGVIQHYNSLQEIYAVFNYR